MKYVDEYRDAEAARKLADAIARTATRPWVVMEVCGGQTHTIVKYGIDRMLPAEVENAYARAVRPEGNPASRRLIDDVFEICDRKWRGVGLIPKSGYKLRYEYRDHDAERIFEVDGIETQESSLCISGQVLKGLKKPHDCPAFGKECTPQMPPAWHLNSFSRDPKGSADQRAPLRVAANRGTEMQMDPHGNHALSTVGRSSPFR